MKKILLATTFLAAGAGMAAADVTISGYGRFGLQYVEDRGLGLEDTQISSRLRLNIDAVTETDVGVTFGARLRIQHSSTDASEPTGNNARFTVGYEGLTVGVGNVDTAADSVNLIYGAEMGYEDSAFGEATNFAAYEAKFYGNTRQGISAAYSFGDINTYFSYIDPDQTVSSLPAGTKEEVGIAADWSNGQISVAGAYTTNTNNDADLDHLFLGAAYSFGDAAVGLNYFNYDVSPVDDETMVTIYGNYVFGDTTLRAYVSDLDAAVSTDTAYGIGADYSLGEGVRISGAIQSGFGNNYGANQGTKADLGVRFNF